jgi:hypothetical protein
MDDLQAVHAFGYDDAWVIEIVLHVALNTWTNYINEVAKTEIDFPFVTARKAIWLTGPITTPASSTHRFLSVRTPDRVVEGQECPGLACPIA